MSKPTIIELIEQPEILEPETLYHLYPEMSERDVEKILVLKLIKHTNMFSEDMDVFENTVHVLNDLSADPTNMQGCLPEHIWYAIDTIARLRPDIKYSHEVKEYIKYIFNEYGIYFYHPLLKLPSKVFENVVYTANKGPFPLKEDFLGIQASKYLYLQEYLNGKQQQLHI